MRLTNRCYAVTGLAYLPPWCVNAGFAAGSETTLVIDTGANALGAATIHGYASAARPTNRIVAVNTEKHFDHIGGNSYFSEHGVEVWGHSGCSRTNTEFREEIAGFSAAIPNPARRAANEARVFYTDTRLSPPTSMVMPDTVFDLGGCRAEVIFTPGHTATNISIWIPEDRVLYTGDCLINGYLPNLDAGGVANWLEWLDSLDRIEQLSPATVVCGHGPVARGDEVARVLAEVRRTLEESIERGYSPTAPPAAS